MVNWTRYRSGDVFSMMGRRAVGGAATGWGGTLTVGMVPDPLPAVLVLTAPDGGLETGMGSFRTDVGTSDRGASSATNASISRRLRPLALASTASQFSAVRCWWSRRMDVSDIAPDANDSRMAGKRRQAFATVMRLHAASSDRPSASVQ